ncbi:aminotransferase class V-fold PLP-dependent enzyme [Fibrella aquatilis]|uniref:Aminotransferase class V-fold PLP-dependent enzyme n=1 Tax=Fibrella aquatilis TaxID=2817059 RepID=A0A939G4P4_9BACT|nr:aminotransferase class V-fold PLP-dependent enzyme [Fibrella aquatilis]MBO0931153.1 aminotransferase class V-fold PLP-dependent enzyme [Fibrella aquatilis]
MNIDQLRRDTPTTGHLIHLNNAGAGLMPTVVSEAIRQYVADEARYGGYETGARFAEPLSQFYTEAAQLLRCQPRNIAFTYSATDAYAKALSAIPFRAGDVVLTTNDDYISNQFAFLSLQKRFGIRIVRANDHPDGGVMADHLIDLARQLRPTVIAVTHVPTNSGRIQPVEAFGTVAHEVGAWYVVDACQSVGQMPVDAPAIGADFLSATGRKFLRGPRGTGLLYISDRVLDANLEPLFIDMRGADWTTSDSYQIQPTARRFEQWETAPALQLGLTEALRYANALDLADIAKRNAMLRNRLQAGLGSLPDLRLLDQGDHLASLLLFTLPGQSPERVQAALKQQQINFSMSFTNFALIDWERKSVEWALRLSPHYYNTEAEIDTAIGVIKESAAYR